MVPWAWQSVETMSTVPSAAHQAVQLLRAALEQALACNSLSSKAALEPPHAWYLWMRDAIRWAHWCSRILVCAMSCTSMGYLPGDCSVTRNQREPVKAV